MRRSVIIWCQKLDSFNPGKMSEPSRVRTRSRRQREPVEKHADPEMATSAAEQFEGERQPSAGGNDETSDEHQSQSQAPGAHAPTTYNIRRRSNADTGATVDEH